MRSPAILVLWLLLAVSGGAAAYLALAPRGEQIAGPSGGSAKVVTVAPAAVAAVTERVESVGTAKSRESVLITAEVQGIVRELAFQDGDVVRGGQVLVRLDSEIQRAELAAAEAELEQADRAYARARELRSRGAVSASTLDEAEAALRTARAQVALTGARLAKRTIAAPFAGVLSFRRVSPGAFVESGADIAMLDDVATVYVDFRLPENFAGRVVPGQTVRALARAFPGRAFRGTVTAVDARIDEATRQAIVRAVIDNAEGLLRPGMLVGVDLTLGTHPAVVVPQTALTAVGPSPFVFVVAGDGRAARRPVTIGRREGNAVEIVSGLDPGEPVVVEGANKISDGDRLDPRPPEDSPVAALLALPGTAPAGGTRAR